MIIKLRPLLVFLMLAACKDAGMSATAAASAKILIAAVELGNKNPARHLLHWLWQGGAQAIPSAILLKRADGYRLRSTHPGQHLPLFIRLCQCLIHKCM